MANIKSQKKRILTNEKSRLRNKAVKSGLRTHVRKFNEALEAGDTAKAQELAKVATTAKWLEKNRPGLHHMAWRVADIDSVSATLRERGLTLLYEQPRIGTGGSKINFLHPKSGKGVLIEVVQPGSGH